MTETPIDAGPARLQAEQPLSRVIGHASGREAGPTLVCVAGIHGNEPAGLEALRRVFRRLAEGRGLIRGELVGLAGNLPALTIGRRYVAKDLNRQWLPPRVGTAPAGVEPPGPSPEDRERQELLQELEQVFARARGEVFVLDIHTTSGDSPPFVVMGDTLRNRSLALQFPVPIILGLEEHLDGTLSEFLTNRGHVTITIEAGQHDSPKAVDHAEAAVWLALAAIGALDGATPWIDEARALLKESAGSVPRVFEVLSRHPVLPEDEFRMEPGFVNLQRIRVGQLLARDRNGEIHSRWDARLLMPLYQELGNDGFFVVREFTPLWLKISAVLRHLRLDAIVHWLPGIAKHPSRPDTLVVDRRVARWRSLELLHLLGFRKRRSLGGVLLVSRRRHDGNRRQEGN